MNGKLLCTFTCLVLYLLLQQSVESKKVIIHVPYRVKNVKHTHTIYKIIPHYHEEKENHEHEGVEFYRK